MAKGMKKLRICIVIVAILMCVVSGTVFAVDSGDNAAKASNRLDGLEEKFTGNNSSEGGIPFFTNNTIGKSRAATSARDGNTSGDGVGILDANIPMVYLNDTQESVASRDSGNDIILPDISNGTHENVSVTSCTVSVAIDDDTCVGYEVYIDGVYQFTEGQGTTPDGFCSFSVTEGTHTLEIRKNGCSASKTHNFLCGVSYTWVSMPDYWCDGGGGDCDNPPTVIFDKSSYYEGDTVQITVSSSLSSVYYEIKDCSGTVRETGYTSGGTISYTVPDGSTSSCCYWTICFYWDEGGDPVGPLGAAGTINVESYQCTKCYNFYVCPDTCDAYVEIEDKVCFGYEVYVDGVLQFTEGQGTTPDGYCSFTVSEGYHTIEIRKDGCSETVYNNNYFQCNGQYKKILQNYWCNCDTPTPPPCDNPPTVQFDKPTYCEGDTIHATVSAPHMKNRLITYEIKDCSDRLKFSGNTIDGSKIEYLIPKGMSSSCCKWGICFSWKVLLEEELYQCGPECYDFEVCPDLKPDLIVEEITWSPTNPDIEQSVTFTVKIKNNGDGNAESSHAKFLIGGTEIKTASVGALSAGSSTTKTFTWTASGCDDHIVKAIADCNNEVTESDEGNNERTETVKVDCASEVKFRGKVLVNRPIISFYSIDIKIDEILNDPTGKLKVGDVVTAWSHRDSPALIEDPVVGDIVEVFGNYFGHDVRAGVESDYIDLETADHYLKPEKKPDLIIEDISWNPSTPKNGDTVTFTVKTKNQGSGNADGFYVCYYVDDSYYDRHYVSSLSSGSTKTTSVSWTAESGNHSIKAIADCYGAITESNEGNNEKTIRIEIEEEIKIIGTFESIDAPMGFTCYIFDIDEVLAGPQISGRIGIMVWDGTIDPGESNCSAINIGDKAEVYALYSGKQYVPWSIEEEHMGTIVGDYKYYVKKIEEKKPDLIIQDISWDKSSPKEGDTITFTVKIKNQGDGNAGSSTVKYYIDDSYVTSDSVSSLSAGSTSTQTFTWTASKCGDVKVKAVADANKKIEESDETNNEKEKTFNIKCPELPDLIVESITWEIKDGTENTVEVPVTIKNQGEADAKGFTVKYYVDGKEHDSNSISSLSKGRTTTETFSWDANGEKTGDHEVKAIVDAGNKIKESSEDNNVKTTTITCIDIEVVDMEIVQVIKSSKLNDNLVRGKPAEVRLTVKLDPSIINVGKVNIKVDGFEYKGVTIYGDSEREYDIGRLPYYYYSKYPAEATIDVRISGSIKMEIRGEPERKYPDPKLDNNHAKAVVIFRDIKEEYKPFRIYFVPIDHSPSNSYDKTVLENFEFIKKVYPLSSYDLEAFILHESVSSPLLAVVRKEKSRSLFNNLEKIRKTVKADRLVGVVQKDWPRDKSWCGIHVGYDSVLIKEKFTCPEVVSAHEIGHTFCLCEEYTVISPCPVGCGNVLPNAPGANPEDNINEIIKNKGRESDAYPGKRCMMGGSNWICPNCYKHLFWEFIGETKSTSEISSHSLTEMQTDQSPTEVLFISGIVYKNGSVEFYELSRMNDQIPDQITLGNYTIECQDADGNVLSETPFDVSFYTEYGEVNVTGFAFAIPYQPETKKVMVKYNGELKDEFVLSANSPTVSVISPNGGESFSGSFTVTWAASDSDGDELSYTLLYSNNEGADWSILAMDINETSYAVNTSMLGGGTKCMVKVIASDGANTAEDTADGCFTVETKNPIASISSPENNSEFMEWERIEFSGFGYDLDDGMLPDDSLVWTSSIDGVIGSGSSFSNTSLSAGVHLITLTARDSEGETANATIVINVLSREPFDTWQSENPYPSISGTHTGTITPNQTITVSKLYTYPCAGTGGHTESVRIYGNGIDKNASWGGYAEEGDTLTFNSSFTLEAGKTYNYVIKTGSYPQIHHTPALQTETGWINCTKFVDANGKEYKDWIPAIKMC